MECFLKHMHFTSTESVWELSSPTNDISNLENDLKEKGISPYCQ